MIDALPLGAISFDAVKHLLLCRMDRLAGRPFFMVRAPTSWETVLVLYQTRQIAGTSDGWPRTNGMLLLQPAVGVSPVAKEAVELRSIAKSEVAASKQG